MPTLTVKVPDDLWVLFSQITGKDDLNEVVRDVLTDRVSNELRSLSKDELADLITRFAQRAYDRNATSARPIRRASLSDRNKEILKMDEEGISREDIAAKFNISKARVSQILSSLREQEKVGA